MCLAKVYLRGTERDDLLLDEVALIKIRQGKLWLRTLFGEEKEVAAAIREIDMVNSSIVLEERK